MAIARRNEAELAGILADVAEFAAKQEKRAAACLEEE